MTPNAAMKTRPPKAPRPFFAYGRWQETTIKRPTSLMVHIEGHGPRRVYRSDNTGRYYYMLDNRRVPADIDEILRLARKE